MTRLRRSLAVDPDIDADLTAEAVNEIERLRTLITELIPFMVIDVRSGIQCPPPVGHYDMCDDCEWYYESIKWQNRIDSGEFDMYYERQ